MRNDNRGETRHRKRIQLKYGLDAPKRVGFTEDVSDEGFFLKTGLVEKPGTLLQFRLVMPGGAIVELEGKVRWAKKVPVNLLHRIKGGMGIKIGRFFSGEADYRAFCSELNTRY